MISRHRGVARVYGVNVKGVPAWLLWRAIYIAKMPGVRQKLGLVWDYLCLAFGRKYVSTQWRLQPPQAMAQKRLA